MARSFTEIKGNQSAETRLTIAFPSNSAAFRSFLAFPSRPSSSRLSLSLTRATADGNGVDPPHGSRAKKGTKRTKPHGGSRDRRAKEESERERERVVGGAESISKLQATLFDPPSSSLPPLVSRHPPFSRLLPSGKATPPARLSLSFASSLSLPHSIWLSPFREAACLPRILISSKVLFPLNRAATRNNALYVRVLRLSFLPPSSSLAFSSSLASVLRFVAALTSPSRFLRPFVTPANSQYTQISSDVVSPMYF